jgi:hypothetical protein
VPFAVGNAKFRDPFYEGPAGTVPYGCWRKSTLDCVGPFDEEMVRGQDDELNFRILAAGGKIWQSPKIVSWYQPRATLGALFHQFFQNGFWKVAAIRKHRRPASFRNLVPVICLLISIFLPIFAGATGRMGWFSLQTALMTFLFLLAGIYFSVSVSCSFFVAKREGWRFLVILPVVFATYQLSYALGFLLGIFHRRATGKPESGLPKVIAAATR